MVDGGGGVSRPPSSTSSIIRFLFLLEEEEVRSEEARPSVEWSPPPITASFYSPLSSLDRPRATDRTERSF